MFKAALASIQGACGFSHAELDSIAGIMKLIHVPAGEYLLKKGEVCPTMYYLQRGSARYYYIHETDDIDSDITIGLYTAGTWLGDYHSFTSRQPSRNNIVAFDDCDFVEINLDGVHRLIADSQSFLKLGIMLNKMHITDYAATKLTADERYMELLQNSPEIIQTFPLKYIASYLRISPETMSRVRSRIK